MPVRSAVVAQPVARLTGWIAEHVRAGTLFTLGLTVQGWSYRTDPMCSVQVDVSVDHDTIVLESGIFLEMDLNDYFIILKRKRQTQAARCAIC